MVTPLKTRSAIDPNGTDSLTVAVRFGAPTCSVSIHYLRPEELPVTASRRLASVPERECRA